MAYIIIFLISLAAATILPMSSEATILYYLTLKKSATTIFVVASLGNILGSIINYLIGSRGAEYLLKKDKISRGRLEKTKGSFRRYGAYSLLLSWVPIIGDPLTLVAGALRYNFYRFLVLVAVAKSARYAILIVGYLYFEQSL